MGKIEGVGAEGLEGELKAEEIKNLIPEVEEGVVKNVEKTPEEIEHDESSKLGRKFKYLENKVDSMLDAVNRLADAKSAPADLDDVDDDLPMTRRELTSFMKDRDREQDRLEDTYNREYLLELGRLTKDMSEEEAKAVLDILDSKHNTRSHKDPAIAAGFNLRDSQIDYLRVGKAGRTTPLNEGGSRIPVPAGLSGGEVITPVNKAVPELDDDAKDFLKKSNMSTDDINDALEKDSPTLKRG